MAALVGGLLYIHGGFNGTECLDDTWVLDPQTWHWERLETVVSTCCASELITHPWMACGCIACPRPSPSRSRYGLEACSPAALNPAWLFPAAAQGPAPSRRRGHAAEVVGDRYLVVHGGYDGGEGQAYLGDAAVLDTTTRTWTALHAAGESAT